MAISVRSEITGSIWKIEVQSGTTVTAGTVIMIMESMKMEIPVEAPVSGVCEILVSEGQAVQDGQVVATIVNP